MKTRVYNVVIVYNFKLTKNYDAKIILFKLLTEFYGRASDKIFRKDLSFLHLNLLNKKS